MKKTNTFRFNKFVISGFLVIAAIVLGITPANSQNVFPASGSVGIGTNTPEQTLHVDGMEVLSSGYQSGFKFRNRGSATNADDWVWYSADNIARFWRSGFGDMLGVNTAGYLGVGTVAPEQTLHVNGMEILSSGYQSGFKFRNRGSATNADDWVWYSADNIARFWRSGFGDMLGVNTAGYLGVGTIAPEQTLHVNGMEILSSGYQSGFKFRNRGSATKADDWVWYSRNNIARFWRYGYGDIMYVSKLGNLGIGTGPLSNFKLAVCGRIRAKGVVVNTGWCDYVFEKDYNLMPLNEVEKYIKVNKHLPDVPSAAEVEKNGIELGEMNATLLRKIEELTLHMIDMKKQNDVLKNRLDKLTIQARTR